MHLGQDNLNADEEDQDIIMIKETGKFVIKDLEEEEKEKKLAKLNKKRTRLEAEIQSSESESEESDEDIDDTKDTGTLKDKIKNLKKKQNKPGNAIGKDKVSSSNFLKSKRQKTTDEGGHIVKYSGSAYKSNKGEGDTLKAGKYEPFAYIQLNPKMLNKRNKAKAVKTFEGVVSHGKKINKRSEKKTEGLLSGIAFKK